MVDFNKLVVYDIETLKNCFIACFYDIATEKKKEFIFYGDDEYSDQPAKLHTFLKQLKKKDYHLIGFNNVGFDAQVLDYFYNEYGNFFLVEQCINGIYNKAQEVINIPEEERYRTLKHENKLFNKQIDLFKQKHYDGKAKRGTSLKWIQFTMRFDNIEEMPIAHDKLIEKADIEKILSYCWNDVISTKNFFNEIKYETELRNTLSDEYGINLLNASEPRLAKEIFGKYLCEEMNIDMPQLKQLKTERGIINFKYILFDYIKFYTEDFNKVLNDFKEVSVDASPGSKSKFSYSFTYKNVPIDLGLGGVHGCNERNVYSSNDEWIIYDIDAKSFYPNLAIRNGLKPQHLGDSFLKVYENLYDQRLLIDKKDPRNYIFKIILNSCYGLSKEINSYIYDPQFTYGITINGQLSILMLTEMLGEYIKELELIQLNTDGITVRFRRKYFDKVMKICEQFEKVTKQQLEYAEYSKMVIYDVNNYLAVGVNGDVKKKGLFETKLDYHKNPSNLIIPKAIEAYYVNGINYKDFINNHTDILDFCSGYKKKRDFKINLYKGFSGAVINKEEQQKVVRYYISNTGGSLVKDYDDGRHISIVSGARVTILNKLENVDQHMNNINRQWYITETKKIIDNINLKAIKLSLFD